MTTTDDGSMRRGSNPGLPVHKALDLPDLADASAQVSTGDLPNIDVVGESLRLAYRTFRDVDEGTVADYIPVLGAASPDLFGLAVVGVQGRSAVVGDAAYEFSIQSVSKPFVFALVCDALGHDAVRERLGVNATGLPFNSVMAIELAGDRLTNPMVNAGAIATTSLAPGDTAQQKWDFILEGLSKFAGRHLEVDEEVLESEIATNGRNEALARLLDGYGKMYFDADEATAIYTRQCALKVTTLDLAVMSATLADGGVNPVTGERVISANTCQRTLALMLTAGLYELSGEWLYEIGLPAKSGVSGAIVTVAPGKGGLATFSPLLDPAGNSVRGQRATKLLSELLGLNILASVPAERVVDHPVGTAPVVTPPAE